METVVLSVVCWRLPLSTEPDLRSISASFQATAVLLRYPFILEKLSTGIQKGTQIAQGQKLRRAVASGVQRGPPEGRVRLPGRIPA